ncbi:MAG: hypothetical protein H8E90_08685 [Anaerolineales bacterium]|nr:hypothetical protein [Anaerolineales bacterium]
MDNPLIYMVNETNDGGTCFSAPDTAIPGLIAFFLSQGYRIATRAKYDQALRNAELADAEAAEESTHAS